MIIDRGVHILDVKQTPWDTQLDGSGVYQILIRLHDVWTSHVEAEQEEADEEDELLSEIEVEQAPPVVPVPAPVEPPVKRKRGRPPKNKPDSKCWTTGAVRNTTVQVFWKR